MDSLHAALRIPRTRLALTGELHFPKIFSACPYEQATLKIVASRAVQRRGSRRQSGRTCRDRSRMLSSKLLVQNVVVTPQWGIEA
jgi:hypothetical protein